MSAVSKAQIEELSREVKETIKSLDIPDKKQKLGELETQSLQEDFWKDQNTAKKVMSEVERLKQEIDTAENLEENVGALLELSNSMSDEERESLGDDYDKLHQTYSDFQKLKFLSGKYDKANAILSIHSGQGGTEANDWTEMLMRMYMRYCERKDFKATVLHMVAGTETGLSTVDILIEGQYVFGLLKRESGVHRLVRLSPFNAQNLRQTSFAGVEVIPEIDDDDTDIEIKDSEIEFKAVRAGGPGGQHVNKTSSAVQITHIPTGIKVFSSEQRSQAQNRETAMKMLKAKLWAIEETKKEAEMKNIKGEHKVAGWGNQIRNYVLHPYKLVKDLRTQIESSNPNDILDGDLDEFIDAQIRIQ